MDKAEKIRLLKLEAEKSRSRRKSRSTPVPKFPNESPREYIPRQGLGDRIGEFLEGVTASLWAILVLILRILRVIIIIAAVGGFAYGMYHGYKWAYAHYNTDRLWWYVLGLGALLDGCAGLISMGWKGVGAFVTGAAHAVVGFFIGPVFFIAIGAIATIFEANAAVVTLTIYSVYMFSLPLLILAVGFSGRGD